MSGEAAATSVLGKMGIIHGCQKPYLMQNCTIGQSQSPFHFQRGLDYPRSWTNACTFIQKQGGQDLLP